MQDAFAPLLSGYHVLLIEKFLLALLLIAQRLFTELDVKDRPQVFLLLLPVIVVSVLRGVTFLDHYYH